MATWTEGQPGVLRLPSGRLVRGRALRQPLPVGPTPDYGLYLLGRPPPTVGWDAAWVRWPDWWLPSDWTRTREELGDVWRRAERERVEVACAGGRGRTGTALACVAILDGLPATDAVQYVRQHYSRHAVETPWQRWYIRRFGQESRSARRW